MLFALLAGATGPQIGPLARVRWMALTRKRESGGRELSAALSYESMVDELGFVLGPAAVGLFAALIAPWLPLAIAAAMTLILVPLFAVHRTEKAVVPQVKSSTKIKLTRNQVAGIALAVTGMIGMGTFFGSSAAGTLAFAGAQGNANIGGLLYAAAGTTSAAAALSVAFWPHGWPQASRWLACAIFMVPAALLLQVPSGIGWMVAALLLVGIPVGPILVTIFTLGGEIAPAARLSTVMTLLSSGIVVGTAIGNGLAGAFADSHGYCRCIRCRGRGRGAPAGLRNRHGGLAFTRAAPHAGCLAAAPAPRERNPVTRAPRRWLSAASRRRAPIASTSLVFEPVL